MNQDLIMQYLLSLAITYMIPASILIVSTWRLSRLRSLTPENYQDKVSEILENNLIEKISERLDTLYPESGLTPPTHSAPFPMVIRRLLNDNPNEDRFRFLTTMYNSLVDFGQQSPDFEQVVHAVLTILSGQG